ncbi:MAG: IS256 family transposase [Gemmatimonadota bacterium]|nr:IS256 family transposase [Gemmatimonadota bacterium]
MTYPKDIKITQREQFALLNDPDFLNQAITRFLQQFMEAEITSFLKAEPYQRTGDRTGYRNGYKPRVLKTRVGRIELSVPKDREGRFSSGLFSRFQRSEKALILALQEAYLQGVSTRKVTKITEALCGTSFSKSQVSQLCQDLDADINAWRERPLEQGYPYLIIDAPYLHIRSGGQVASEAVLIVSGISESGHRDILAIDVAHTETEATYADLFKNLKKRGLKGVHLVISDHHEGLQNAIKRHFQGASWQHCQTHFHRNIKGITPPKYQREVAQALKDIFNAPDQATAQEHLSAMMDTYEEILPNAVEKIGQDIIHCLACFHFPQQHQKRIRTTNLLERLNREIKRRADVVQIFPNQAACQRLIGALCMEWSDEWITGRRYLDMTDWK